MNANERETYYSIERLVDFGISMAVAQQMISGFQQAMGQTAQPQNAFMPQTAVGRVYFALINSEQVGPLSGHDIIRMVRDSEITASTLLWAAGSPTWMPASSFPEVMSVVAIAPPPRV